MSTLTFHPIALLLLLSSAAVLYLGTMPLKHGLGDAPDEIEFATSSKPEIRPHHLLTSLWNRTVLAVLPRTHQPGRPLQIMMLLSAVATGYLLYALLFGFVGDRWIALMLTALFLVSNGIWIHGTIVETGIIPLGLLTGALCILGRRGR